MSEIIGNGIFVGGNSGGGGEGVIAHPVHYINSNDIITEFETNALKILADDLYCFSSEYDWYFSDKEDAFYCDLENNNTSNTIYTVIKSLETGGDYQGVGCNYSSSVGNAPNIFTHSSRWYTSFFGWDTNTNVISTAFHVLSLSLNASTKKANYYIDGVSYGEKTFSNCGRYPSIGGGVLPSKTLANTSNMVIAYGAFVLGAEDSETIIANHQELMQIYSDYIGT